jgi:hypothetical protein
MDMNMKKDIRITDMIRPADADRLPDPPPLDWRGTPITVGCRVLYGESRRAIGVITDIYWTKGVNEITGVPRPRGCRLRVRWQEDEWDSGRYGPVNIDKQREATQVRVDSVTVWPGETCQHTLPTTGV